eukprot:UN26656
MSAWNQVTTLDNTIIMDAVNMPDCRTFTEETPAGTVCEGDGTLDNTDNCGFYDPHGSAFSGKNFAFSDNYFDGYEVGNADVFVWTCGPQDFGDDGGAAGSRARVGEAAQRTMERTTESRDTAGRRNMGT